MTNDQEMIALATEAVLRGILATMSREDRRKALTEAFKILSGNLPNEQRATDAIIKEWVRSMPL